MAVNGIDKKWTEWVIFLLELNLRGLIVENITSESLFVTFAYLRGLGAIKQNKFKSLLAITCVGHTLDPNYT